MPSNIVLKSLSVLLGIFFLFVGFIKLSSLLSRELHRDLRKDFVRYAKVFPFAQILGVKIPAKWYRRIIGSTEFVCGLVLATIPAPTLKRTANVALLLNVFLSIYSQFMAGDRIDRTAPTLAFGFLLIGRLVIEWQYNKKLIEEQIAEAVKLAKQE